MSLIRQALLAAVVASLAVSAAGCNILAWPLHVLAPPAPPKTVPAECTDLRDSTVAVVIYADMDTLYQYPTLRQELGTAVARALTENVKGVQVISPRRVARYQDANGHWASLPARQLGQALGVQRVLYLTLTEFSTHAPDNRTMALGRITADASVYGTEPTPPGADPCRWRKTGLSHIEQPADPLLAVNDQTFRLALQTAFAAKLARCFYDHQVPRW